MSPPAGGPTVVVGAGLAGLVAGRALVTAGRAVTVIDKAPQAGGRLATRRIGAATFDHGAQFFTVRSSMFRGLVEVWSRQGCPIHVWGHGLARSRHIDDGPQKADSSGDGHPRYVVSGGMNGLAKHLADGIPVRLQTPAQAVTATNRYQGAQGRRFRRASIVTDGAGAIDAACVVLTAPVPQSLALVDAGDLTLPFWARTRLEAISYAPCLALLAVLDRPVHLPGPGGVQLAEGPVQTLSDNSTKGVSQAPAVTIHLRGDISDRRYDDPDDAIAHDVLGWVGRWLGAARVTEWQLKRWRYAQPVHRDRDRALTCDADGVRLVFAGDAFGDAKVEGAACSGVAAADAVLSP